MKGNELTKMIFLKVPISLTSMLVGFVVSLISYGQSVQAQTSTLHTLRIEANAGSVEARLKLAECFALGLDCPESQDSVHYYLNPLLEQKHPEACFLIGNAYLRTGSQKINEGLKYMEIAAEARYIQAVIVLLEVYSGKDANGPFANAALAAKKNDNALFKTASRAPELKEPVSAFYLGMCYLDGRGTPKNDSLALNCLEYSASWDYCPAQLVLGDFWYFGKSALGHDLNKAREYYAATQGNIKCTIAQQGAGMEGMGWVDRCFRMLWNATWNATCLLWDRRIELPVPDVKKKDFIKNRYP